MNYKDEWAKIDRNINKLNIFLKVKIYFVNVVEA